MNWRLYYIVQNISLLVLVSFFDLTQIDVEQTLTRSDINRKTTARLCGGNLI